MRAYPTVDLTFRTTVGTEQTVMDILNGSADVGFASMPVYSPALQATELFEDELVLVVGRGHKFAGKGQVAAKEIEHERFILFEPGASIRRTTDQFFARTGTMPRLALETNDTFFVKLMAEHGMGISFLPAWAVRDDVAAGRLAQLRVKDHQIRRHVKMISLGRFQPSATRTFLQYILDHKAELQQEATGLLDD
jgi:DNA-binding transcriptional LysR family regulator